MHFSLILFSVGIALLVRLLAFRPQSAESRWQHTLGLFLFSPLLLLITAVAVLGMGNQGRMLGIPVGEIGCVCAAGVLAVAVASLVWQAGQTWWSLRQIQQYPVIQVQNQNGFLLDTTIPFAAQVGFWQPKLVLSRGLLDQFYTAQIKTVLIHEQAHAHYHDTFWFFWLGWLRQLTAWLPHTEALWQELLLLREIRADCWAANQVDPLLVAETLLQMAQAPLMDLELTNLESACAAISPAISTDATVTRLEERIEALLSWQEEIEPPSYQPLPWIWLAPTLIPLMTVLLHR